MSADTEYTVSNIVRNALGKPSKKQLLNFGRILATPSPIETSDAFMMASLRCKKNDDDTIIISLGPYKVFLLSAKLNNFYFLNLF